MKNFLLKSMMAIAVTTTLFSCNKEEEVLAKPTITLKSDAGYVYADKELAPGDSILIGATLVSNDSKLKSVSLTVSYDGAVAATIETKTLTEKTGSYDYAGSLRTKEGTEKYTLTLTDNNGEIETKSFTITVKNPIVPGGLINKYTATLLGGQNNANVGSYYATTTNAVFKQNTAAANSAIIDIIYYYGSSNKATLVSPNDATVNGGSGNLSLATVLTKQNKTEFAPSGLTAAQFDAINDDKEITAIIPTSPQTLSKDLAVGSVILFKTEAGKLGLIKVSALTVNADGQITIDVKVQK